MRDTQVFSTVAPFYKCKGRKQKMEKEKKAQGKAQEKAPQAEVEETQEDFDDATPELAENEDDAMEAIFGRNCIHTCLLNRVILK